MYAASTTWYVTWEAGMAVGVIDFALAEAREIFKGMQVRALNCASREGSREGSPWACEHCSERVAQLVC